MTPREVQALNYIRSKINEKPLAYQLGFLQGFLAKQMCKNPELVQEFKNQTQKRKD